MLYPPITEEKIRELVKTEFSQLYDEFEPVHLPISEAQQSGNPKVEKPGVYIYLKNNEVIKVGKSNENVRKRAVQHITDNTQTKDGTIQISNFKNDKSVTILFFILKKSDKIHWLIALEDFLEHCMDVKIKSLRRN